MNNSCLRIKCSHGRRCRLWIPEDFALEGASEPWKGSSFINIEKAVATGLSFRPLKDTITDIYKCVKASKSTELKAGMLREREQELLEGWFQKGEKKTV